MVAYNRKSLVLWAVSKDIFYKYHFSKKETLSMFIALSFQLFKTISLFQDLVNPGFNVPVNLVLVLPQALQCNLQDEFTPTFYDFHSEFNKCFFL